MWHMRHHLSSCTPGRHTGLLGHSGPQARVPSVWASQSLPGWGPEWVCELRPVCRPALRSPLLFCLQSSCPSRGYHLLYCACSSGETPGSAPQN